MGILAGRKIQTTSFMLGDVEIKLKSIPFGRVLEIQKHYKTIENEKNKQLEYIKKILLEFSNLEEDDLSDSDYSLTVAEVEGIFTKLLNINKDPKVLGQALK
jgi:hypothetical protein